jgi:hypothetical protein
MKSLMSLLSGLKSETSWLNSALSLGATVGDGQSSGDAPTADAARGTVKPEDGLQEAGYSKISGSLERDPSATSTVAPDADTQVNDQGHGYDDWNSSIPIGTSADQALTPASELSPQAMSTLFEPNTLGFGSSGSSSGVTSAQDFGSHSSNAPNTFISGDGAAFASFAKGNGGSHGQGGGSGGPAPGPYTSGRPGGFQIVVDFDASVAKAPSGFVADIENVANYFTSNFTNPTTITIDVGYGEVDNFKLGTGALGESITYYAQVGSYSALANAFTSNANLSLPADPISGKQQWWVTSAEGKALALLGPSASVDGYVGFTSSSGTFSYDPSKVGAGQYDFTGTAAHEFSEVMGRALLVGQKSQGVPGYGPLDLFHFSAQGAPDFSGTTAGYFSVDSGATPLKNFNTNPSGDFGDWAASMPSDAFDAAGGKGQASIVSQADNTVMEAVGWKAAVPPPAITAPWG